MCCKSVLKQHPVMSDGDRVNVELAGGASLQTPRQSGHRQMQRHTAKQEDRKDQQDHTIEP